MNILLTGSSGLIGQRLQTTLTQEHTVSRLLRRPSEPPNTFYWAPNSGVLERNALKHTDAVVHLAGASIAKKHWCKKRKAFLQHNRSVMLRTLANAMTPENTPKTFLIASAVGAYDKTDSSPKTEESPYGQSFDAELCKTIETTLNREKCPHTRFVFLRLGIVLSPNGGALKKLLPPFKMGLGGRLGTGEQPFPWISLTDATRAIQFCLENEEISGPVNLTAPARDTNASFTQALGKALNRPTCLPLPSQAVKLMFGEMGEELLLKGTHATPKVLTEHGFTFQHSTLKEALQAELAL